jgi:hypothetical protein
VFKCFGWPTGVDPVPVALARLNGKDGGADRPVSPGDDNAAPRVEPSPSPRGASFREMLPVKQAGILCSDPKFWRFISEEFEPCACEDDAVAYVRRTCQVASRKYITAGSAAEKRWQFIVSAYRGWDKAAEVVG